jgi:hypothetical protein
MMMMKLGRRKMGKKIKRRCKIFKKIFLYFLNCK